MDLPEPGDLFESRYEIVRTIGAGGSGSVFQAKDVEVDRFVAIKILTPRDDSYTAALEARFKVEARVIAKLQSPHVVRLYEFGTASSGLLYMVFEYVPGVDLATIIQRRGALGPELAMHITRQLLDALDEAHELGVFHRDIKPANILVFSHLDDDHSAKLVDFGIAKVDPKSGSLALTKSGVVLGTPRYMAPEQVFSDPVSPATDLYSLGLVFYEMLAGRPAKQGSQREILTAHVAGDELELPGDIAPRLRAVIERMVVSDMGRRYQRVEDVRRALGRALGQPSGVAESRPMAEPRPMSTPQPVPVQQADQPLSSRAVLLAGVGIGAFIALILVLAVLPGDEPQPADKQAMRALPSELTNVNRSRFDTGGAGRDTAIASASDVGDASFEARPIAEKPDGCGTPHPPDWQRRIPVGEDRQARVFSPREYDPNRRHPLLLVFQPRELSAGQYVIRSDLQDRLYHNLPVVAASVEPSSKLQAFDPWTQPDDLAATVRLIDEVAAAFCIDRSRIYAMGHGRGAVMAHRVACEVPLSGLVLSSYGVLEDVPGCTPKAPVPTLRIVGRDDPFVPLDGGYSCVDGPYVTSEQVDERWRGRNGCRETTSRWKASRKAECVKFGCDTPYVRCMADGGYHLSDPLWAILAPNCPTTQLDLKLMDVAWPFFEQFARPIDISASE